MTFACPMKLSVRNPWWLLLTKANLPPPNFFFLYSVILNRPPLSILCMSSFLNLFNYCGFLKILTVIFQFHSFNFCKTVSVSTSACPFLFPWLFFYGLSLHPLRSTLPPTVSASIFYLLTPKSFISSHCLSSSTSMTSYPEFSPKFFSDRFNKTRTE